MRTSDVSVTVPCNSTIHSTIACSKHTVRGRAADRCKAWRQRHPTYMSTYCKAWRERKREEALAAQQAAAQAAAAAHVAAAETE